MSSPRLEDLMSFPVSFTFRVIVAAGPEIGALCAECVVLGIGREVEAVEVQPSSQGRWVAVRVRARVESAEEIRAAWALLGAIDGVKLLL